MRSAAQRNIYRYPNDNKNDYNDSDNHGNENSCRDKYEQEIENRLNEERI